MPRVVNLNPEYDSLWRGLASAMFRARTGLSLSFGLPAHVDDDAKVFTAHPTPEHAVQIILARWLRCKYGVAMRKQSVEQLFERVTVLPQGPSLDQDWDTWFDLATGPEGAKTIMRFDMDRLFELMLRWYGAMAICAYGIQATRGVEMNARVAKSLVRMANWMMNPPAIKSHPLWQGTDPTQADPQDGALLRALTGQWMLLLPQEEVKRPYDTLHVRLQANAPGRMEEDITVYPPPLDAHAHADGKAGRRKEDMPVLFEGDLKIDKCYADLFVTRVSPGVFVTVEMDGKSKESGPWWASKLRSRSIEIIIASAIRVMERFIVAGIKPSQRVTVLADGILNTFPIDSDYVYTMIAMILSKRGGGAGPSARAGASASRPAVPAAAPASTTPAAAPVAELQTARAREPSKTHPTYSPPSPNVVRNMAPLARRMLKTTLPFRGNRWSSVFIEAFVEPDSRYEALVGAIQRFADVLDINKGQLVTRPNAAMPWYAVGSVAKSKQRRARAIIEPLEASQIKALPEAERSSDLGPVLEVVTITKQHLLAVILCPRSELRDDAWKALQYIASQAVPYVEALEIDTTWDLFSLHMALGNDKALRGRDGMVCLDEDRMLEIVVPTSHGVNVAMTKLHAFLRRNTVVETADDIVGFHRHAGRPVEWGYRARTSGEKQVPAIHTAIKTFKYSLEEDSEAVAELQAGLQFLMRRGEQVKEESEFNRSGRRLLLPSSDMAGLCRGVILTPTRLSLIAAYGPIELVRKLRTFCDEEGVVQYPDGLLEYLEHL